MGGYCTHTGRRHYRGQLTEKLSRSSADRLVRSGALDRQATGIYLVRGAPLTYEARLWAAALSTGGILSHATAAHLWGCLEQPPDRIHVTVLPQRSLKEPDGVTVHRLEVPRKLVQVRRGLPVTARAWTLLDQLASLPFPEACTLADRALQRGWLTTDQLARRLRDYPCRYGNATLRRLAKATGDGAVAQSERLLQRILRGAGITGWVPNLDIWVAGELVGIADLAFPRAGLIIEIDGWAYHTAPDRFQRDRTRQNNLVTAGWTVLPFTWSDLVERPSYVVAMIKAHLDRVA